MPRAGAPRRLWITRPEEDAAALAAALHTRGIEPFIEPLLRVVWHPGPPLPLTGIQALLATSANGIRAFAGRNTERQIPVLAVGDATARAARAFAFTSVASAAGDVAALARLARARLNPADGTLLHVAAQEVAGDLASALAADGFTYRRVVLYATEPVRGLSDALIAGWRQGEIEGVIVYSPRTGRTLSALLAASDLVPETAEKACYCLSGAVARTVAMLPWQHLVVASAPTQAALLAAISEAPS